MIIVLFILLFLIFALSHNAKAKALNKSQIVTLAISKSEIITARCDRFKAKVAPTVA